MRDNHACMLGIKNECENNCSTCPNSVDSTIMDRYCSQCGDLLIEGSISYQEGFHIDGCDALLDYEGETFEPNE